MSIIQLLCVSDIARTADMWELHFEIKYILCDMFHYEGMYEDEDEKF
jgi:hypothetical protein